MTENKEQHHVLTKAKLTEMVRSAYKDDKLEIIEYKVIPRKTWTLELALSTLKRK